MQNNFPETTTPHRQLLPFTKQAITYFAVSVLFLVTGCTGQRPLTVVRADAREAEQFGRIDEALADYQEYVDRDSVNLQARMDLARVLLELGKPKEAAIHADVAYSLRPDREDVVDLFCKAFYEAGYNDSLMMRLRERAEGMGSVDEYMRLAEWSDRMGDTDQARMALLSAIRLAGDKRKEPYILLADIAERKGDKETAITLLRKALYVDIHDGDDKMDEKLAQRLRDYGFIPGPTIAISPLESP